MIYAFLAVFIWASSFTAGKIAYGMADPVLVTQLRFLLAGLLVLPFFPKAYRQIPVRLRKRVWFLALLNFPISFLLQFIGLKYTSAAIAVTVIGIEPLLTVLIGFLFFKQNARLLDWLMSLVAFMGILLIVFSTHQHEGTVALIGVLLIISAAISFVFCLYLGKKLLQELDHKSYSVVLLGLAPLLCLPFTLCLTQSWAVTPSFEGTLAILYLAWGCGWLAISLWNKSIQTMPASHAGIIVAFEPVFGVFIAMAWLGESLSWLTLMGIMLVISATIIAVGLPLWRQYAKNKGNRRLPKVLNQ